MRSQAILRRSHAFLKHNSSSLTPGLITQPSCPRNNCFVVSRSPLSARFLSSSSPSQPTPPPDENTPIDSADAANPVVQLIEEDGKPKSRRTRLSPSSTSSAKDTDPVELPDGLDILWTQHNEVSHDDSEFLSALPPPEIFEDALNNLLITLHPQTQHRATYPSTSGSAVEPTLGLYCPMEGGDYIVDATVRELARRTNSEVLVLDAVQLAAGEWGKFGKAANALQLPKNPLHFPSVPPPSPTMSRNSVMIEDEEDTDIGLPISLPQQMTLTVMTPAMQGRTIMTTASRRSSSSSKMKVFFDALVNTPSVSVTQGTSAPGGVRPRLIYIRDFPTLAESSAIWYPPLLSAVRQRRKGPISRPSSVISSPMTIIFGMSPPLIPSLSSEPSGSGGGLMNILMSRSGSGPLLTTGSGKVDWSEDEASEKRREKRLQERLKKWEKGDLALHDEFPKLAVNEDTEGGNGRKPEVIVIGGGGGMPSIPGLFGGPGTPMTPQHNGDLDNKSNFFRSTVLVPSTRSTAQERSVRIARRREINELTMRMGVGSVGGVVEIADAADVVGLSSQTDQGTATDSTKKVQMWEEWGNKLEVWSTVRRIADRAIGAIMASGAKVHTVDKPSLEPTVVPWSVVQSAWEAQKMLRDRRKAWMKDASSHSKFAQEDLQLDDDATSQLRPKIDELVEKIKNDPDLDTHEQRLLSCIVDSVSMPTSFNQVHLPPHTIDSVRTIVSLPLLHPHAFKQGILKDHSMTGCLLFGPPGTGKTLVVRALAKEAGCRMLNVSPSDVMDMYVGEGEKLVKAVFSLARRLSPCVIFLDEIDALFGARMSARESGGAIAHRGVITEFMQEMDGLKSYKDANVIVIGATNRPFDLDDAVLRRLPRRLLVDLPGVKEREEILKILLRDESLADNVDLTSLAKKTESFSGSDLKHLCVSAALDSVKEHVHLPWTSTSSEPALEPESSDGTKINVNGDESIPNAQNQRPVLGNPTPAFRTLQLRNFLKAMKEITPSSSESLGSLAELRKWNDEFGEGRQSRKKRQVWGKGRFGFVEHDGEDNGKGQVKAPLSPVTPSTNKAHTLVGSDESQ